MPAQFDQFIEQIRTTDDVERIEDSLDRLNSAMYKTDGKPLNEKIDELLPSRIAVTLSDIIRQTSLDQKNLEEIKRLITELRTRLSSLTTISLTLAFDPPQKSIDDISEWIKKNFGNEMIMEISVRPQILGGAIIVTKGRYIDKSLKKKLGILFEVKKPEIEGMLKSGDLNHEA